MPTLKSWNDVCTPILAFIGQIFSKQTESKSLFKCWGEYFPSQYLYVKHATDGISIIIVIKYYFTTFRIYLIINVRQLFIANDFIVTCMHYSRIYRNTVHETPEKGATTDWLVVQLSTCAPRSSFAACRAKEKTHIVAYIHNSLVFTRNCAISSRNSIFAVHRAEKRSRMYSYTCSCLLGDVFQNCRKQRNFITCV